MGEAPKQQLLWAADQCRWGEGGTQQQRQHKELPSSAALCSGEHSAAGMDAAFADTSTACSTLYAVAHLSPGGLDALLQNHSCLLQHLSPLLELFKCFLALLEQNLHSTSNRIFS